MSRKGIFSILALSLAGCGGDDVSTQVNIQRSDAAAEAAGTGDTARAASDAGGPPQPGQWVRKTEYVGRGGAKTERHCVTAKQAAAFDWKDRLRPVLDTSRFECSYPTYADANGTFDATVECKDRSGSAMSAVIAGTQAPTLVTLDVAASYPMPGSASTLTYKIRVTDTRVGECGT